MILKLHKIKIIQDNHGIIIISLVAILNTMYKIIMRKLINFYWVIPGLILWIKRLMKIGRNWKICWLV
jgi:hypothetical protein